MNFADYQAQAIVTRQPNADLLYLTGKLASEGGEAFQEVAKHIYHGRAMNESELIEELGDALWYIANAADMLRIPLEEIAAANIAKLRARHGAAYNPKHYQGAQS